VARECEGPVRDAVTAVCPRRCRLRNGAGGDDLFQDQDSARDRVDWAGLPINLDFAFSQQQRDKVYAQHLMRKRGSQLRRRIHNGSRPCVCELAEDDNLASH